ncbi:MAG: hypothetical protein K2I25_05960, partial [Muribaculaceae bacterium]|nr:hypothetical protein [Muribaculaceae bacterium]
MKRIQTIQDSALNETVIKQTGTGNVTHLGIRVYDRPVYYSHLRAHETPEKVVCRSVHVKIIGGGGWGG